MQALDTVRYLEEGVLTHPADGDIGSILGWGFSLYTGGTISYIETIGLPQFVTECDELAKQHGPRFDVPAGLRVLAKTGGRYYPLAATAAKSAA